MAEGTAPEIVDPSATAATVDMDVENAESAHGAGDNGSSDPNGADSAADGDSNQKRSREEDESQGDKEGVSKKQKVEEEKSVEEERLEKLEEREEEVEKKSSGPVNLGHKSFGSSLEMFDYFYSFLHTWPPYLNVNKYEHIMLLELLKNGHTEPDKKIGGGIRAFQVRKHPMWKSKCFFLIREDESVDDFSFRKCVDHILPLPAEMQLKSDVNKALGGSGGGKHHGGKGGSGRGGGRGGGRGHGRGGRWKR